LFLFNFGGIEIGGWLHFLIFGVDLIWWMAIFFNFGGF